MLKQLFQEYSLKHTREQNALSMGEKLRKSHFTLYRSPPGLLVAAKQAQAGTDALFQQIMPDSGLRGKPFLLFAGLHSCFPEILLPSLSCMVFPGIMQEYRIRQAKALLAPLLLHAAAVAVSINKAIERVIFLQVYFHRLQHQDNRKKAGQKIPCIHQQPTTESASGHAHKLSSWFKLKSMALIAVKYPTALI